MAGDCLTSPGIVRPYEVHPGHTDAALDECKALLSGTPATREVVAALLVLAAAESRGRNRLRPNPRSPSSANSKIPSKVMVTTGFSGSSAEGAEVDPACRHVGAYSIWEHQHDTRKG
jgi:hypothetical protein